VVGPAGEEREGVDTVNLPLFGMLFQPELTGPLAALLAGLVTSLHCVGMCGPLACAACSSPCGRSSQAAAGLYHTTRLGSYIVVGLVVGWLGERVADALLGGATRAMTWIFVLFFLAVVAGFDKRLRLPTPGVWLGRLLRRREVDERQPFARAAALGSLTPLLPCAPLYLVVAAAALAGSALHGAVLMLAFGLGTIPLLFAVQNRLHALEKRVSPQTMDWIRRGLALASVVLLLFRGTYTPETGCLMCH
jgi:sulfite exporter TauE/SafE